jgi:hypothetical protein
VSICGGASWPRRRGVGHATNLVLPVGKQGVHGVSVEGHVGGSEPMVKHSLKVGKCHSLYELRDLHT